MYEWPVRDTWKHPERDGYPGEEHDNLYLKTLRAEETDVKTDRNTVAPSMMKTALIRNIGALLTTPGRCLRAGLRTMFKTTRKPPQP